MDPFKDKTVQYMCTAVVPGLCVVDTKDIHLKGPKKTKTPRITDEGWSSQKCVAVWPFVKWEKNW